MSGLYFINVDMDEPANTGYVLKPGETICGNVFTLTYTSVNMCMVYVIVKERHETIMGYKPRERVALEWFIPIIVELLVL